MKLNEGYAKAFFFQIIEDSISCGKIDVEACHNDSFFDFDFMIHINNNELYL